MSKLSPEMLAEHKAMMAGVPEGKAPSPASSSDTGWKERQAYRKAFEDHVSKFLAGDLKDAKGETIQNREEALTCAHLAGKKALQELKKTGLKFSVYTD